MSRRPSPSFIVVIEPAGSAGYGASVQERLGGAGYFDRWYADMASSPRKDEIQQRHLGLSPRLLSTSLLGAAGLDEVIDALALSPGQVLLDVACGRGGYGLEISSRTQARLVGVDFSAEALRQARALAMRWGQQAEFVVGDLIATGLETGSVDAVVCIDAVQFADAPADAYRELRRVLRPRGRAALTCWRRATAMTTRFPSGCGASTSPPACRRRASLRFGY